MRFWQRSSKANTEASKLEDEQDQHAISGHSKPISSSRLHLRSLSMADLELAKYSSSPFPLSALQKELSRSVEGKSDDGHPLLKKGSTSSRTESSRKLDLEDNNDDSQSVCSESSITTFSRRRRCCLRCTRFRKERPKTFYFSMFVLFGLVWHVTVLLIYFLDLVPDSDECRRFQVPLTNYVSTSIPEEFWPADPRHTEPTRAQREMPLTQSGARFSPHIRLNEATWTGYHNSYHVQENNWFPVWWYPMVKAWHYTHEPLGQQLCEGIRFFEFDMHIRSDAIMNYHLQFQDMKTHCFCISECFQHIKDYSDANPDHFPIVVYMGIKVRILEDARPNTAYEDLMQVEQQILRLFNRDRIFTPDMLRREFPTLREAVAGTNGSSSVGFPRLSDMLGRTIFILGTRGELYARDSPNLENRVMFRIATDGEDDHAAFVNADPLENDGETIGELVNQGYIVKSRVDHVEHQIQSEWNTRLENAIDGQTQILYMDFNIHNVYSKIPVDRHNRSSQLAPITTKTQDTNFCQNYERQARRHQY